MRQVTLSQWRYLYATCSDNTPRRGDTRLVDTVRQVLFTRCASYVSTPPYQVGSHLSLRNLLRKVSAKRGLVAAFGVGLLNQAVSSGMNFFFGLYLVRALVPVDFGLFGISFACVLFYGGLVGAFFSLQMILRSPDKAPDDQESYGFRVLVMQVGCIVATAALAATLHPIASSLSRDWAQYALLFWGTVVAGAAYALKEYCVRYAYVRRVEFLSLHLNCLVAFALFMSLVARPALTANPFTVASAIWAYAAAHVIGVAYFTVRAFKNVPARCSRLRPDFAELWRGGLWSSLAFIVYFVRLHSHTIVISATAGPSGLAVLNASRVYVTPAMMLTPSISHVVLPRMAAALKNGSLRLIRSNLSISAVLLSVALVYAILLWGGFDFISQHVTGPQYGEIGGLVLLWVIYACSLALRNGVEVGVQALRKHRQLALLNTFSMIMTMTGVLILTRAVGLPGAILGLSLGEALLAASLWFVLIRGRHPIRGDA